MLQKNTHTKKQVSLRNYSQYLIGSFSMFFSLKKLVILVIYKQWIVCELNLETDFRETNYYFIQPYFIETV
jgi:hypothetical protein